MSKTIEILNRKASHLYFLVQSYEAGIQLTGTEVKSVRSGKANLSDSYCNFDNGQLYAHHIHISEYEQGSIQNHDPKRPRKLLLNRSELKKLERKISEKGMTIVPIKMYFSERGMIKLEISLATGKKSFDKRETLKEKDVKRDMDRNFKTR
ncbi:MAG: SsrA-binding protein SmpB [Saprospiraceae bacterium]|nr:SsrA-binding protein SmpB [Saprospiraceae bacterium]MBK7465582.1 SsrA-binding protein SmpB [Saprospiraceae bacterium]MBK9992589.1 SsrA-binding protein SmpB [Saprospiraceae bacterium]